MEHRSLTTSIVKIERKADTEQKINGVYVFRQNNNRTFYSLTAEMMDEASSEAKCNFNLIWSNYVFCFQHSIFSYKVLCSVHLFTHIWQLLPPLLEIIGSFPKTQRFGRQRWYVHRNKVHITCFPITYSLTVCIDCRSRCSFIADTSLLL
jgi:hypothetical protein